MRLSSRTVNGPPRENCHDYLFISLPNSIFFRLNQGILTGRYSDSFASRESVHVAGEDRERSEVMEARCSGEKPMRVSNSKTCDLVLGLNRIPGRVKPRRSHRARARAIRARMRARAKSRSSARLSGPDIDAVDIVHSIPGAHPTRARAKCKPVCARYLSRCRIYFYDPSRRCRQR